MLKQAIPKLTVYELDNKKKYVKSNAEHPHLSDFGASVNLFDNKSYANNDSARNVFLRGNPFLHNPQTSEYNVLSIEDYLIVVKKEELAFGDVIRNERFSCRKRKAIIKKAFKTWDKDYCKKKDNAFLENDKVIEVIGEVSYLKFSLKLKVLIYLLFALMLFVIGTSSFLWEKIATGSLGYSLNHTLTTMFQNTPWLSVVGNVTIYLILILIFYSSVYNIIMKDFKRNYRMAQQFLSKTEITISKNYKKKFRKARRYYISLINNKKQLFYAPLDIGVVEEGKINITVFNNICKTTIDRAYKMKKSKPYIIALKKVLLFLSISGSLIVCLFSLYNIVLSIFN